MIVQNMEKVIFIIYRQSLKMKIKSKTALNMKA